MSPLPSTCVKGRRPACDAPWGVSLYVGVSEGEAARGNGIRRAWEIKRHHQLLALNCWCTTTPRSTASHLQVRLSVRLSGLPGPNEKLLRTKYRQQDQRESSEGKATTNRRFHRNGRSSEPLYRSFLSKPFISAMEWLKEQIHLCIPSNTEYQILKTK